jgi:DNA-binding transcriptional LysR family regulator
VALTDAGQRYVARIGPALQEIRLASEEIHSDTGEPAGTLRLNVPNHIGTLFLDQLLIDFMIRYPKMRVETVSEARMIDIVAEGYDAGIRLEESVPQDMIAVPLTGRSASSSPPRRTISPVTAFRRRRTICFHIRGSACVWPTAGSTAGSWPVGVKRTRLPCRRALRRPIFLPRSAP